MQSGHGLGGKRAGIDLGNSSDRESIFYINGITDGKMRTDTVKNILKEKWYNVRALILNSCYYRSVCRGKQVHCRTAAPVTA